jgi:hypothetical protein
MANSASALALALAGRTTSTPARAQASRSMFSTPADRRPTARSSGAAFSAAASTATEGGDDQRTHVEQATAQPQRVARQLGCHAHPVTCLEPLDHFGFQRLDDQEIHGYGDGSF